MIADQVDRLITKRLSTIQTLSLAVVKEVDSANRKATIILKHDERLELRDVPIASIFASAGVGIIIPIKEGDVVIVLFTKQPLTLETPNVKKPEVGSKWDFSHAFIMPMMWPDTFEVPTHEDGELLIFHHSGTSIRFTNDGKIKFEKV